jgi:hypothetical protein
MNTEHERLAVADRPDTPWRKWGPYLSERQWGTVREDYSESGNAWEYFSHDHARSRAYRWGEDGIAGVSDERQRLCLALTLWNGVDPILKERMFGLTNSEGNHAEDVKEYYFYLDNVPTHSYMRMLYKYPQRAFPYAELVERNHQRTRTEFEYELLDTGIFAENRYFDVFVEWAKATPDELLMQVTAINRGIEPAELHLLPTLWFRNEWSWGSGADRPRIWQPNAEGPVRAWHPELGEYRLETEGQPELLFTENETNTERIFGVPNRQPWVKDSIHEAVVRGNRGGINPARTGTKVAAHYRAAVPGGGTMTVRLRLVPNTTPRTEGALGQVFQQLLQQRQREADEFYATVIPEKMGTDERLVMRQALAGMLWSKQFYLYDVDRWLEERGSDPFLATRKQSPRNDNWHHMFNGDVISMPDKWEYPWYAAWDLAFHVLALTMVDPDFGRQQLKLMLRERYMHPNGQIPAYEWNFGDVNPPVHAWSTIFTYRLTRSQLGVEDREWLKSCFQKLLLNFTWWVNRKDRMGRNVFEGGFLGLDNIGVFDRSSPLPTGGYLEQADGTAWMALFCQNMLEIALELAESDPDYGDMALKFSEHFIWIASSMSNLGGQLGMWDEIDGFYYDVLRWPDGRSEHLKVRSMVGLLPLCAATVYDSSISTSHPDLTERFKWFLESRPEMRAAIHDPRKPGVNGRRLASILDESRLRRVLTRMLDEEEFLSPHGIRSLSRAHRDHPFLMTAGGREYQVNYLPGESDSGMFGGNSNWRGPVWVPVNALIVRALLQYYGYYGEGFLIECPTGSGRRLNLFEVAREISRRMAAIFLRNDAGQRPVYGGAEMFQNDPHWRDLILFYEYFHGDNGAGLGASHQTGWTGVVARLMHLFSSVDPRVLLATGKETNFAGSGPRPPK